MASSDNNSKIFSDETINNLMEHGIGAVTGAMRMFAEAMAHYETMTPNQQKILRDGAIGTLNSAAELIENLHKGLKAERAKKKTDAI